MPKLEAEIRWLLEEKQTDQASPQAQYDIDRLRRGEPLAYVIGHQPFRNLSIQVTRDTLIPRVETEWWIDQIIRHYETAGVTPQRILDLGAGSGCLGLALLAAFPESDVTFVDRSAATLPVIRTNLRQIPHATERSRFLESDLFHEVTGVFDLIVSNPPYISERDYQNLPRSVHDWEPREALVGGRTGMETMHRILIDLPRFLEPDAGVAVIEHGPGQGATIRRWLRNTHLAGTTHRDQYRQLRFTTIRPARSAGWVFEATIIDDRLAGRAGRK